MTGLRVVAGPDRQGAAGDIRVSTTPADRPVTVRARILDSDGLCVWEGTSKGQNALELPFRLDSARLWSPEAPALYQCQVEVRDGDRVLDSATCRFGVRHVGERAQRIWLNAIPIYLRGMCYLYDHPATGLTVDMDVVRRDLDDLEAMGVNCLRSHFPLPSQFLSECDRRGMLLWLEVPIYCIEPPKEARGTPFADPGFQALALQMLGEMVEQAANHPSVILWGVGNECRTDHPEAAPFFRACVDRVRALDSTRPISYASLYGNVGCAAEMIDVIGVNEYWGWYDRINFWGTAEREPAGPLPLELPQLKACLAEKSKVGKPLLLTEFGADSMPGYLSDSHELWSEDYHAELIRRTVEIARQFPAVCGVFPFGYSDYRDPSKPVNHYWHGLNLKGVVDYHRGHKLPWKAVQEAYRSIGAAPDNR
jgi:beta-glucuronidase